MISIHALLAESDLLGTPDTWTEPVFLSTLSLRRATYYMQWDITDTVISIHALLAESDRLNQIPTRRFHYHFYPRSPCGERLHIGALFLAVGLISIHALLAESDEVLQDPGLDDLEFLSTLSLRRATQAPRRCACGRGYFYPRSPCGERRSAAVKHWRIGGISIHALLAESDLQDAVAGADAVISIHALLAESDLEGDLMDADFMEFLSTLSLRRATSR